MKSAATKKVSSMRLARLRRDVLEANLELVRRGLVLYTFGNASGIDRDEGLVVIKPSGVPYDELKPEHMVVTDLSGAIVEGNLRPSSDLPTHLALYRNFQGIGGVAHTHSEFATAWAQAGHPIPCLGTTHADYFHGSVPVTEELTAQEISGDYEKNTGTAICRAFLKLDPEAIPAVLVRGHAPFCWGLDVAAAAHNAVILEAVARMAYYTVYLSPDAGSLPRALHDKHFLRKHGKNAYYGQVSKK
ncbi:MAG TPA: L-ribulose-5-phosphate 4-epimerase [Candidatus Acidoferrales bacterium]|nr:L-ribulose-5-phosphate 4-epimerase [Candidatus Acidoferrales bacterium]